MISGRSASPIRPLHQITSLSLLCFLLAFRFAGGLELPDEKSGDLVKKLLVSGKPYSHRGRDPGYVRIQDRT